jgi:hypothetical protein
LDANNRWRWWSFRHLDFQQLAPVEGFWRTIGKKRGKNMKCGIKCKYWYFTLRIPAGIGPICKKWNLPINDARDKCFAINEDERAARKEHRLNNLKLGNVKISKFPGSLRGWGPIITEISRNDLYRVSGVQR